MRLDGRDPGGRLAPLALGLATLAAAALWWSSSDQEPQVAASAPASAPAEPSLPAQRTAAPAFAPNPSFGELSPTPSAAIPPPAAEAPKAPATSLPVPPSAPRARATPAGTSVDNALALRRLPHSNKDRGPVGGVGSAAMHIDRIAMGTTYDGGSCVGPVGKFSIHQDDVAHVCFRVVHHRVEQEVVVRWERNGRLMRRAFVSIGASHGYRTRAGLRLRRTYGGDWTVRIMSPDGVELASHAFQVLR